MTLDSSPRGDSALPSPRQPAQRLRTLRQLASIHWQFTLDHPQPPVIGNEPMEPEKTSWYDIPVTEFLELLEDPDGQADLWAEADDLEAEDVEAFQARLAAGWEPAQFGPIEPDHQADAAENFPFRFEPSPNLAARIKAHVMKGEK